ncbi:MAG: 2Fe-2S iron-sulfur cluster binding domain-containing protein [Sphingobacteriales bacterium]|nr:MAG: 2Fe-2S iron-sulfur cluster binding domain-containing protein [Sphingobacteriales bacterium]
MYKKYKIVRKVKESSLVFSLYLEPLDGAVTQPFLPGQHLMFKFNIPGSDIPLFRYYSFSEVYDPKYYRVSVKKEGIVSSYIFDHLEAGDILEAKGPQGTFALEVEKEHPVALFGGGIGITPLLSMAKTIATANPKRRVALFYGVNDRDQHSFKNEVYGLRAYPNIEVHTFYNNVHPEDVAGSDYDYHGFINFALLNNDFKDPQTNYYICGPAPMMHFVENTLLADGVKAENIRMESFASLIAPEETGDDAETTATATNADEGIKIYYSREKKELVWDSRYRSILEFSEAHDIEIVSGCLFGDCGTCLTTLTKGEVKYMHPTMIIPDAGDCLPCSCIPLTDIVLDV